MLKLNFSGSDSRSLHQHHLTRLCWARAPSCLAQIVTLLAMVFAGIRTILLSPSVRLALLFCAWSISLNMIHFSSIHGIPSAETPFFNHWITVNWHYKLHHLFSQPSVNTYAKKPWKAPWMCRPSGWVGFPLLQWSFDKAISLKNRRVVELTFLEFHWYISGPVALSLWWGHQIVTGPCIETNCLLVAWGKE